MNVCMNVVLVNLNELSMTLENDSICQFFEAVLEGRKTEKMGKWRAGGGGRLKGVTER